MRRGSTLPFLLLIGGLAGCGAGASRGNVAAAELEAQSARAEAMREHARLIDIEERLLEMERRFASQTRGCDGTSDPQPTPSPPVSVVTTPTALPEITRPSGPLAVLTEALWHMGLSAPGGHFEPHTRRFDWGRYRVAPKVAGTRGIP